METKKIYRNADEETTENLNLNELEKVSGGGQCFPTGFDCPVCGEKLYLEPNKKLYVCFNPNCFYEHDNTPYY